MTKRDFTIPITLAGKQYLLRNDHNSKCLIQKTLGPDLKEGIFATNLGVRAALFGMLGRINMVGKFVHLSVMGEITLEECGEFFDTEPQDVLVTKIAEAFEAARAKDDPVPDPNAVGPAKSSTGESSSSSPAESA